MVAAQGAGADLVEAFLEHVAGRLDRRLREIVRDELVGKDPRWVDQHHSILGPRRHCAAVRRRIANGELGARMRDRDTFLLAQEAIAEELGSLSDRAKAKALKRRQPASESAVDAGDELERRIAQVARR